MRILFTGGGSGGHIFPIIAVKRELESMNLGKDYPPFNFQFIGGRAAERKIWQKEGMKQKRIISVKWRRYFSLKNFIDIVKLPFAFLQAIIKVWLFMPDVIFSKGGPGSLPVVFVGWLYRIPIIIHESDSVPGVTNKISVPFAKKIIVSFKETKKFFSKRKTIVTGNPIRQNLLNVSRSDAKKNFNLSGERKVILIIGGSQGAKEINSVFIDVIYKYIKNYEIIHICGSKNFKETNLLTKGILRTEQRKYYHLYPYLNEEKIGQAYIASDVVLSRAGAGTIFELAAFRKPSVLIPLKGAAQIHQTKNAQYFARMGCAIVVEESNVTRNFVFGRVSQALETKGMAEEMQKACRKFAKPEAGKEIAVILIKYA